MTRVQNDSYKKGLIYSELMKGLRGIHQLKNSLAVFLKIIKDNKSFVYNKWCEASNPFVSECHKHLLCFRTSTINKLQTMKLIYEHKVRS